MSNVVQVRYTIATRGLRARYNPLLAIVYPIHIHGHKPDYITLLACALG